MLEVVGLEQVTMDDMALLRTLPALRDLYLPELYKQVSGAGSALLCSGLLRSALSCCNLLPSALRCPVLHTLFRAHARSAAVLRPLPACARAHTPSHHPTAPAARRRQTVPGGAWRLQFAPILLAPVNCRLSVCSIPRTCRQVESTQAVARWLMPQLAIRREYLAPNWGQGETLVKMALQRFRSQRCEIHE